MGLNPKLPYDQRILTLFSRMSSALESISSTLFEEFGPIKRQEIVSPSEEFKKQFKENQESQRREDEIKELKKSNKIAVFTARIAVIGLLLSAIISALQLLLNWTEYRQKQHYQESTQNSPQSKITSEVK